HVLNVLRNRERTVTFLPRRASCRVDDDRVGDLQQPGAERVRVGQLADAPPGEQVRLLHEVLAAVAVAGGEVDAGVHQARGAAEKLLERRPRAATGGVDEGV